MLSIIEKPKAKHSPHVIQPIAAADNPDALLKLSTVSTLAGIGQSTIYLRSRTDPTFPKLRKFGKRCTRIKASDLTAWLKAQVAA